MSTAEFSVTVKIGSQLDCNNKFILQQLRQDYEGKNFLGKFIKCIESIVKRSDFLCINVGDYSQDKREYIVYVIFKAIYKIISRDNIFVGVKIISNDKMANYTMANYVMDGYTLTSVIETSKLDQILVKGLSVIAEVSNARHKVFNSEIQCIFSMLTCLSADRITYDIDDKESKIVSNNDINYLISLVDAEIKLRKGDYTKFENLFNLYGGKKRNTAKSLVNIRDMTPNGLWELEDTEDITSGKVRKVTNPSYDEVMTFNLNEAKLLLLSQQYRYLVMIREAHQFYTDELLQDTAHNTYFTALAYFHRK